MAMASTVSLSEPQVLAHTKRRLFPDSNEPDTYAVTDTQFAMETWLSQRPIPEDIRSALAPFNHVQLGSGYPDLVGVRLLDSELLAVERFGDQPPLIAVEAKGHTEGAPVDVERGIVQAYDRLHEANAAFTAAPSDAILPGRSRANSTWGCSELRTMERSYRPRFRVSSAIERPAMQPRFASRRPHRVSRTGTSR